MLKKIRQIWNSFIAIVALTIILAPVFGDERPDAENAQQQFLQAIQPRQWHFPRDHGRHDGFKTEWWYFTGNLSDASGRKFGYQITFFQTSLSPRATTRPSGWALHHLYFAHAAVTDIDGRQFLFKDRLSRQHTGLAESSDSTFDARLMDWTGSLHDNTIRLHAVEQSFAIDLSCVIDRPPVLQGPGGVNKKGRRPEQASYYYSMPRLKTSGTITVGGHKFEVQGRSWMDHEFSSNALSPDQVGWDWMGLSFADGNDLMIYRMRNKSGGNDYLSGTLIKPDGTPRYLSAADITLSPSNTWNSPASGAAYPQRWAVTISGLPPFVVTSRLPGQELITSGSTKVDYFEGSAEIVDSLGRSIGDGYLEMTGYGKSLGGF